MMINGQRPVSALLRLQRPDVENCGMKLDFGVLPSLAQKSGVTGVTGATSDNVAGSGETPLANSGVTGCDDSSRLLPPKHRTEKEGLHRQPGNGAGTTPVALVTPGKLEGVSVCEICTNDPDVIATTMTADEERAVQLWLERIGETAPEIVSSVLALCSCDRAAHAYFVNRAGKDG
jgi:hypothetical protein